MVSSISSDASYIQNQMNQIYENFMNSTETSSANGLTKDGLTSLGNTTKTVNGTEIGGSTFFKALSNEFDKLDKNADGKLTGDEVPTVKATKVEGTDSDLSIEDTAVKSGNASNSNNSITSINLNNATLGQVLVASQSLGLSSVSGYLETMSTDTDGSSATANVLKNSTTYNIPDLLENWASFDKTHGAEKGAEQLKSIEKQLVSSADANGNIALDTKTDNTIATADASGEDSSKITSLSNSTSIEYTKNILNKILQQYCS